MQQLRNEVRFITSRLGAIIREQAGERLFGQVEKVRHLCKAIRQRQDTRHITAVQRLLASQSLEEAHQLAHAFSLFFQLVNLCEERERIRRLQSRAEPAQSLRWAFRALKEAGISLKDAQRCVDDLEIQPVLTAHPTEAKRRTTMNHILRLASLPDWDAANPRTLAAVDEILETLWQTLEVRERRVDPLDEVDHALFFFDRVVFDAVASFNATFDAELRKQYPGARRSRSPLTFASWVGGDRDGNPFVTPEISLLTAAKHRELVLRFYEQQCGKLLEELTHAVPREWQRRRPRAADETVPHPLQPQEVFCQKLLDIRGKLRDGYRRAEEFVRDLERLQGSLLRQKASGAASGRLARLIEQARVFGFHLAELDFRDHRDKLEQDGGAELLQEFQTIRKIQQANGPAAANHFILSMTRSAGDLRALLQLARRAHVEQVDIVPLFETIEDLKNCADVMRDLWADAKYRAHLGRRGDVQEVMFGYSDSNKNGGYLAANWALYGAQKKLALLADKCGVKLRLFHGKGGSIDRGGGASYRSLRAQPYAAHGGRIRITEQGEIISLKYSNLVIAQRNLEQLTSAVIVTQRLPQRIRAAKLVRWEQWMNKLAAFSLSCYQQLVYGTPEFQEYFCEATPIDLIDQLRIGSRPSRRRQTKSLDELRTIPWVFALTQSRHLLSAWYGLGYALTEFVRTEPGGGEKLNEMYQRWPFFATLLDNVEVSLAKTDLYIARRYASLVTREEVRNKIFGMVEAEYQRSVKMVLRICHRPHLLANQPALKESIRRRNPYVDPLNYLQIQFLQRWRHARSPQSAERFLRLLALTVNGIAFGMKSTG